MIIPTNINGLTVTSIGNGASAVFGYFSGITNVTIPGSITSIDDYAFYFCYSLTNVTIGNGVTNIGPAAFYNCPSLAAITVAINNSFYSSTNGVLFNKSQTQLIQCPVAISGSYTIPDSVTAIEENAFLNCFSVASVTIPGTVINIGDNAFEYCGNLTGVYFMGNPPTADSTVFNADYNVTVYYSPCATGWSNTFGGVPAVAGMAPALFTSTTNAGAITITGYSGSCGNMIVPTTINGLPVTGIGTNAFENLTNLTSVTISNNVTNIGEYAFSVCTNLTSVYFNGNVPTANSTVFAHDNNATIYYSPCATGWRNSFGGVPAVAGTAPALFSFTTNDDNTLTITGYSGACGNVIIPTQINGLVVTSIGYNAFPSISLTCVTIPDSVTSIGEGAFQFCSSLISVMIGNNITNIGDNAFASCGNLTTVYFIGNAPTADATVFNGDDNATVYYLSSMTGWSSTFAGLPAVPWLPGLYSFTTNAGAITIIGYSGAGGAATIPNYINGLPVTSIGDKAFLNTSVTSVVIPNNVTSIGESAFSLCVSLASITIPDSVTSIGQTAFYGCQSLTNVTIPNGLTNIEEGAFQYCSRLTNIVIPSGVTSIPMFTFQYCSSLASVTIGNGVTNIGEGAFQYCFSLTSVTIGNSVTRIGHNAFEYCGNLTTVYFQGNAPAADSTVFVNYNSTGYDPATVYYLIGATGWKSTFAGLPVVETGWILQTGAPAANWTCAACSADGTKLVAVSYQGIYTSPDSGIRWTLTSTPATDGGCVASSADGTKLVAALFGGGIYTSPDSGTNWTEQSGAPEAAYWDAVASSADGTKLVAAMIGGGIYTSSDSGADWTEQSGAPEANSWDAIASSADGTKLVAASFIFDEGGDGSITTTGEGGDGSISTWGFGFSDTFEHVSAHRPFDDNNDIYDIYTSSDSGITWNNPSPFDPSSSSLASSADGTKLLAAGSGGGIYTSSDSGADWTSIGSPNNASWSSVASSADGTRLVAASYGGGIYTSSDSGINWTEQSNAPEGANWDAVASSADGTKLVAAGSQGIYTFNALAGIGSLQVTTTPAQAVTAGAQWQVDGGATNDSGVTLELLAGVYTLSFTPAPGWNAPANLTVTITSGKTTMVTGVYLKGGPALTITSPKSSQSVSNALLLVTGMVTDNAGLGNVFYQLNGGSWTPASTANGFTNWTANVTLTPGSNTVCAYAVDISGSFSSTNKVSFLYIPSATLTVQTNGLGGITPVDNGKLLAIGTNYTLTASPGKNWLFSNWIGGTTLPYAVLGTNLSYAFPMQSNLTIEANFVTNLFPAAQGTYNGLFAPTNNPRQQTNSGAITLSVTSAGAFSGKLYLGFATNSFNGQFDVGGNASAVSTPHGGKPLTITLQLNLADQSVQGTVTDGSFVAMLNCDQAVFSFSNPATDYEGQYTLIIPGVNNPAAGPFGTGYGTVAVSTSGAIGFVGSLADGTSVSQSTGVSKDGYWPFYVPLYGGKGSLWGTNYFTNHTIMSTSPLSWINATNSSATAVYRSGFTNEQAAVIGSFYTATNKPLLNVTSAQVTLDGGNLPSSITNQITWASNNSITVLDIPENTNGLKLTITSSTGAISGSFANPGKPGQAIQVNGVILQDQTNAQGYFLGTNQSGAFLLNSP